MADLFDEDEVKVESHSIPGKFYIVNKKTLTCTCPFFRYNQGKSCQHIEQIGLAGAGIVNAYPFLALRNKGAVADTKELIASYDKWLRTRVSENFVLRDFMFSAFGSANGIHNLPEKPEAVVAAAKALCERVCEPILKKFGQFSITYGYSSRELMQAEWPKLGPTQSSPHNWDRGTFGNEVYARIDILPYAVEDGKVSKNDFARWMMHNLDLDLLMQWGKSNVICVTVGPKPRRVWLEWVQQGKGEGGSNKITHMGEHYWNNLFPELPPENKPKFHPSQTGGKMYWK